jgi:apolipoprotein N-acyltransferase
MAIIANSFLMAFVFMLYHRTKRRLGERFAPFIFISYWLGFEFFHLDWDLSWPWLTLGNAFASDYKWIQWYEYTGVFGGSMWVLAVNWIMFSIVKDWIVTRSLKQQSRRLAAAGACIIIPIAASYLIYSADPGGNAAEDKRAYADVVVVQPNIDPYNAKFSTDVLYQADIMLRLASARLDSSVDYVVLPETALSDDEMEVYGIWENTIESSKVIKKMNTLLAQYPNVNIVTGASTNKEFLEGDKRSATARRFRDEDRWYESYNTALQLDTTGKIQVYHKSKLVPGVEKMPFPAIFKPLENLALDMGGTVGSLGMQDERTVFFSPGKEKTGIAPVICYESIYGEYVSEYIRNGARLIFIITNDGWWGDTPGYKQHLVYGRLRAIENRTAIARSANTGISCFINEMGDVSQPLGWWVEGVIREKIPLNTGLTFYAKFGDYIARIAAGVAIVLAAYSIALRFMRNKKL